MRRYVSINMGGRIKHQRAARAVVNNLRQMQLAHNGASVQNGISNIAKTFGGRGYWMLEPTKPLVQAVLQPFPRLVIPELCAKNIPQYESTRHHQRTQALRVSQQFRALTGKRNPPAIEHQRSVRDFKRELG